MAGREETVAGCALRLHRPGAARVARMRRLEGRARWRPPLRAGTRRRGRPPRGGAAGGRRGAAQAGLGSRAGRRGRGATLRARPDERLAPHAPRRSRRAPRRRPRRSRERVARDTWRGLEALHRPRERAAGRPRPPRPTARRRPPTARGRRLHQRHQHRPAHLIAIVGAPRARLARRRPRRSPRIDRDARHAASGSRPHARLLLQLLRHHLARAHQQLALLRRLGVADRRPDGRRAAVPGARRPRHAR